jgi:O-antigen/teichoic acid export membrane protein
MSEKSKNSVQDVSIRSNLYWNTLIRIPSKLTSFAISIIIARILLPKDFGILAIAMMLIGYANIFTNFGFNQAIVQKRIVDKKTLNSIFTFDFTISTLIAATFFFTSGFFADFFKTPECAKAIKVLCSVFLITSFYRLPHAILRRDINFKAVSLLDIANSLLMSLVTLVLAIKGWGYWALVYGQLIPLFIIAILLCIKARWLPIFYYSNSLMKPVYGFGVWSFLAAQLTFISQHVDKFAIGRWLGAINLGFYDKSKTIAGVPNDSILININAVLFSSFSRNQESKKDLKEQFKKSLTLTALITFPIYTGLIVVAPYFVYALLGEKWSPMILPFQIILFGSVFKSFGGLISSLNVGMGKYKSHALRLMVSTGLFAMMCFLLLPFKLNGIAISFVIFSITTFILTLSLSICNIGLAWKDIIYSTLSCLAASLIMLLIVKVFSYYYLKTYTMLNLISLSGIGTIIYFIYLLVDQNKIIKELRRTLLSDIRKRVSFLS